MVAYLGSPAAINGATYPEGPVEAVQQVQQRLAASGILNGPVVTEILGCAPFLESGGISPGLLQEQSDTLQILPFTVGTR